jgi:acyl carrier protein
MNVTNKAKLKEIIATILELKEGENPEDVRKLSHERWDSLAQVNMIAAIESEFFIVINSKDYSRFTSYKSIEILLDEICAL